ncbi:MAG: TRAM domain-containing protein, partial [Candidatus Eremiobacteraeota bacterium]|nr:TRAM domain-containing protein [Candidatus Eremiobacteraeota bacterium]
MTIRDTPNRSGGTPRLGTTLELGFNDLLANGQAVGRSGGVVVFCFGPLPHEKAVVRVTAIKPKYVVADLVRITRPSPFRAVPFCPVFGTCGGCQVQHLAYPAQLAWKTEVVRNALARIGGFADVVVHETIGTINPRNYRNKMSLVVSPTKNGTPSQAAQIGFYKQRSHEVVPIDACPIVMPQLSDYIARLNAARASQATAPAFQAAQHIVARSSRATK